MIKKNEGVGVMQIVEKSYSQYKDETQDVKEVSSATFYQRRKGIMNFLKSINFENLPESEVMPLLSNYVKQSGFEWSEYIYIYKGRVS